MRYDYRAAVEIYAGSNGDATKAMYDHLARLGPAGEVALNLFRAHKNSGRAKTYRGGIRGKGSYKGMAYDRKAWAIENLCRTLGQHADALGIAWGWKVDPGQAKYCWVLYVETPAGQVSFHTEHRGDGPDFDGRWDGIKGEGAQRICRWIGDLCSQEQVAA